MIVLDGGENILERLKAFSSSKDDGTVEHVHKTGARFHTSTYTVVDPPGAGASYLKVRCSKSRCERNKKHMLYEIGHLQAVADQTIAPVSWCREKINSIKKRLDDLGIEYSTSEIPEVDLGHSFPEQPPSSSPPNCWG